MPKDHLLNIWKIDADDSEIGWKTVVDFTDGGKTKGMPVEDVLKFMRKISQSHPEAG